VNHKKFEALYFPAQALLDFGTNGAVIDVPIHDTGLDFCQSPYFINDLQCSQVSRVPNFIAVGQVMADPIVPMSMVV